jgi:peroxiredoxin
LISSLPVVISLNDVIGAQQPPCSSCRLPRLLRLDGARRGKGIASDVGRKRRRFMAAR